MGTGLLIIIEVFGWGVVLIAVAAVIEAGWSRIRRRSKKTLT